MVTLAHRTTRSQDVPAFNSDTPRKRTRYSSGGIATSRHGSITVSSRTRDFRSPRIELGQGGAGFSSAAPRRARRINSPDKPRYDSAADAAAAATGQVDGYKPREERSWEEFHQELSLDTQITVFSADEVDGISPPSQLPGNESDASPNAMAGSTVSYDNRSIPSDSEVMTSATKRRPGRPPRRAESMLNGLGSPPAPKIVPIPAQNPREKLNLPKPSYRKVETFAAFETDKESNQVNYVDRTMANVGFQEFETFTRTGQQFIRHFEDSLIDEREPNLAMDVNMDKSGNFGINNNNASRVEYDMDEQDGQWLEAHNVYRREVEQVDAIKPAVFEITMTQIEKEWHALERRIPKPNPKPPQTHRPRSSSAAAVNGETAGAGEEQDSKCAICDDGDCENSNAIVFCDGCDLAVHQECYGVPFIPEGQWLCRKCQAIGTRSKPVCIFCPNSEGAFKQTTESRWAHLLCAIWIPEVSIANQTFMEPISDVLAVPRERWEKLTCYICSQKMGACIQCGHRACYTAFHVTCAKRAKLFLRMKSSHGTGANLDASVLKAFCHKHVPTEWQIEHESDKAVLRAQAYYRKKMRNIEWADSVASATTAVAPRNHQLLESLEENLDRDDPKSQNNATALKRKRQLAQKNTWRLQSGAPVVPQVVQEAVEASLARFGVRKRKEFVSEACKYWTMKRDSRRGAAMLKRLQLQLETFSANEVTRRNFAAMGSIGGARLQRRLEMAEKLLGEVETVQRLCDQVKVREQQKLQDAELLKAILDGVYFPIPALVEPVLRKVRSLDSRNTFLQGIATMQSKLERRLYTSVLEFARDMGLIFRIVAGLGDVDDVFDAHTQLANSLPREENLTDEEKEVKKLAKRIVKAVQQPIREAILREAELGGKQYEQSLERMRTMPDKQAAGLLGLRLSRLNDSSQLCNGDSVVTAPEQVLRTELEIDHGSEERNYDTESDDPLTNDGNGSGMNVGNMHHRIKHGKQLQVKHSRLRSDEHGVQVNGSMLPSVKVQSDGSRPSVAEASGEASFPSRERMPARDCAQDSLSFLYSGGAPWYAEHFDPFGTTVYEERWTGPEVFRGLSEELSEMDDDELQGLGPQPDADEGSPGLMMRVSRTSRRTRG